MSLRRRRKSVKHTEIPPYFPPSRYETTKEDPVIDYENKKILSLPSIVTLNVNKRLLIHHVGPRNVKDALLNEAEGAILGEPKTPVDPSGVHPGILYGGPLGGILAPIGVWFFRLFKKKRKKNKQRRKKQLEDSNEENSEEENVTMNITNAVSNKITDAGKSIVSHIKEKLAGAGSSMVEDLKTQALAQEVEILEDLKATILEQEKEMMMNIEQKIANTQKKLVDDLKNKLSVFGSAQTESIEVTIETFERKKNEEENLCKLTDSDVEIMNTVKRRISNAQDALIPEIEKSIETTNKNIIMNIENKIPEARGPNWDRIKSRMKDRGTSLFKEIKSILTCTENKIIDDVKSQISETKMDILPDNIMSGAIKNADESTVSIIQPELNLEKASRHQVIEEIIDVDIKQEKRNEVDSNKSTMQHEKAIVSSKESNLFSKIKSQFSNHKTEKLSSTMQRKADNDDTIEKISIEKKQNKPEIVDQRMKDAISSKDEIAVDIMQTELSFRKPTISQVTLDRSYGDVEHLENAEKSTLLNNEELLPGNGPNVLKNITHTVSTALHLSKHASEPIELKKNVTNEAKEYKICVQRTSPIPIPVYETKLDKFPVTQGLEAQEILCDDSSESSSGKEEDKSMLDEIQNSVPYSPFSINFSGIPYTVKSFIQFKNHNNANDEDVDVSLSEVKIESENMAVSASSIVENPETNGEDVVEYTEYNKAENTGQIRLLNDSIASENISSRKWIVLDYIDENCSSHLPRNIEDNDATSDSHDKRNSEKVNAPPTVKWLQLVEEDVNTSWPEHLPKNLHSVNDTLNHGTNRIKGKNVGKHIRNKSRQLSQEDSESPEEDEPDWRRRLSKYPHLISINNGNDRKESLVSTISEFSTTSSVDSTSSGTLESRDSFSGYKLPNFDSKLKKRNRMKRPKSLDSGMYHYDEYITMEIPAKKGNENMGENIVNIASQTTLESKTQEGAETNSREEVGESPQKSEKRSYENSQEPKSEISTTEIVTREETKTQSQSEPLSEKEGEIGTSFYEECIVGLRNQEIQ